MSDKSRGEISHLPWSGFASNAMFADWLKQEKQEKKEREIVKSAETRYRQVSAHVRNWFSSVKLPGIDRGKLINKSYFAIIDRLIN